MSFLDQINKIATLQIVPGLVDQLFQSYPMLAAIKEEGDMLTSLLTRSVEQILRAEFKDATRGTYFPYSKYFARELQELNPRFKEKLEAYRPLYNELQEVLDELWPFTHDTVLRRHEWWAQNEPDIWALYLAMPNWGDAMPYPIAGLPQSVRIFARKLRMLL